jgi:hypothetical protein
VTCSDVVIGFSETVSNGIRLIRMPNWDRLDEELHRTGRCDTIALIQFDSDEKLGILTLRIASP